MKEVLLRALERRANHRGLVMVREAVLLDELGSDVHEFRATLASLEAEHRLEVLSPPPFVVVALLPRTWSGRRVAVAEDGPKTGPAVGRAYSFHSSLSQSQLLKESYRRPDADRDDLLQEILTTLGESDPTTFRGALRNYPPGVIRTALARIRAMKTIRKNPTALFRYLLPRIANEPAFKK